MKSLIRPLCLSSALHPESQPGAPFLVPRKMSHGGPMGLDKQYLWYHGTSTYLTTGLTPIVTQAIAKEKKKEGTIRQQELEPGGPGATENSNSTLLRGFWVKNMNCPHRQGGTSIMQDVFVPKSSKWLKFQKKKKKRKSFRTKSCQGNPCMVV